MSDEQQNALRSHLSRERTFLSWLRTSLAFMAFGIAVEKFSLFLHYAAHEAGVQEPHSNLVDAKILAVTLIVLGGLVAFAGAYRVQRWARCTPRIDNQPKIGALLSLAAVTCLIAIVLTVHVLLTHTT